MADPTFEVELTDADGNEFQADEQYTLEHLTSIGEKPVGFSKDGSAVLLQDDQGIFEVPVADFWRDQGYNVKAVKPLDPVYDHVDTGLRAKMESLPDDGMKRFYLERELQNRGIKDAKVMGNGSDWFVADPQSGKWIALTNKPGLDWSDAGQALNVGVSTLGSVAGAGAGTFLGGPLGTVAGGALGSVLSRGVLDSAYRFLDDSYADTQNEYAGELAKDYGKDAALSAVAGLIPAIKPIAKASGFFGRAAKEAGKFGQGLGGLARNETVANLGAPFLPVVGPISNIGTFASLPKRGVEGLTALARKASTSPTMESIIGKDAQAALRSKLSGIVGDTSEEILSSMGAPNLGKATEQLGKAGIGVEQGVVKGVQGLGKGVETAGTKLSESVSPALSKFSEGFGRVEPDIIRQTLAKGVLDKTRGPGVWKKQTPKRTILTSNSL